MQTIDACLIADDVDERALLMRVLERGGIRAICAADVTQARAILRETRIKVVISDFDLPDSDGISFCQELRKETSGIHFLLMSASNQAALASDALEAGADDFLSKPVRHSELLARIRVGVRLVDMHDQLRRAAVTDGLTRLNNHGRFHQLLESEVARASRYDHKVSLAMLDVDFFKAVNDAHGHQVGNAVLESIAEILRAGVRDSDQLGRLGGEEFGVILPRADEGEALQIGERLRLAIRESLRIPELQGEVVTVSLGVAEWKSFDVGGVGDLINLADRALYLAKRRGRDQVAMASELNEGNEWNCEVRAGEVEAIRRRLAVLHARTKDVYVQSVAALLQVLNERDPWTARHAMNVAFYAHQVSEHLRCPPAAVQSVYNAAFLHDIGKVGIPDHLLRKRTVLTEDERLIMNHVPQISTRIIGHLQILDGEARIIQHEKEWFDGTGKPAGLAGTLIPIGSRVLHVVDVFDAMTTDRVHRRRHRAADAIAAIEAESGSRFDPDVVAALKDVFHANHSLWGQRIEDTHQALLRWQPKPPSMEPALPSARV